MDARGYGDWWTHDGDFRPRRVTPEDVRRATDGGLCSMLDAQERQVLRTRVGKWRVSTVFLVIDHSFGDGVPLLFETMVFGESDAEPCWRYATVDAARAGHARVVEALVAGGIDAACDLDLPAT